MIPRLPHGRSGHARAHNGHTRGHGVVICTDQAYRFPMDNNLQDLIRDARTALLFDSPSPAVVDALSGTLSALVAALSTPPTDDVRDALEMHLREAVRLGIGWPKATFLDPWIAERLDAILAAFEVRPRGTVTDAEVEAAARAYAGDEMSAAEWEWVKSQPHLAEPYLTGMRAALEAAREAQR